MSKPELPSTPTLNPEYNYLIAKGTHECSCEECDADLTGEQVYETSVSWLCRKCRDEEDVSDTPSSWREDFHSDG